MAVTISFKAGDVLTVGTDILVTTPRPVDPVSAQSVINIVHTGTQVDLIVTVSKSVITVPTKGLAAGGYDFMIGELLDTSQKRMSKFTVVPLILKATKSSISSTKRVDHSVRLAIGELSTIRLSPGETPPEGFRVVEMFKVVDVESGRPDQICLDDDGNTIDGEKLLSDVSRRRWAKYGRVHETLWHHIRTLKDKDNEHVDIVVWPLITQSVAHYQKIDGPETQLPDEEKRLRAHHHNMCLEIVEELETVGAHVPESPANIPPEHRGLIVDVHATIMAKHVETLAQSNSVGAILLDDRNGIHDLADSIAIARSDQVRTNTGYTGEGVRVAVYEAGPSDTTDLKFEDRYISNPPPSDHARLTSAIVKNVEANKPHGHAPDCSLYSANSFDDKALNCAIQELPSC